MNTKCRRQLNRCIALLLVLALSIGVVVFRFDDGVDASSDTSVPGWRQVYCLFYNSYNSTGMYFPKWEDPSFWRTESANNRVYGITNYPTVAGASYLETTTLQAVNNFKIRMDVSNVAFGNAWQQNGFCDEVYCGFVSGNPTTALFDASNNHFSQRPVTPRGVAIYMYYLGSATCWVLFVNGTQVGGIHQYGGYNPQTMNVGGYGPGIIEFEFRRESIDTSNGVGTYRVYWNGISQDVTFAWNSNDLVYALGGIHNSNSAPNSDLSANSNANSRPGETGRRYSIISVNDIPAASITEDHVHTYVNTVPITCTQSGYQTCSVCGAVRHVDAGHDYQWIAGNNCEIYKCLNTCGAITQKRVNVTYNANGGSSVSKSSDVFTFNATSATASANFSTTATASGGPNGKEFGGWSTNPGATAPDPSITLSQNTTLYAVWMTEVPRVSLTLSSGNFGNAKSYSITNKMAPFSLAVGSGIHGGVGSQSERTSVHNAVSSNYGTIGLGGDPRGANAWFIGWNTRADGSGTWVTDITDRTYNGQTLSAVWQYPVVWNANGGNFTSAFAGTQTDIIRTFTYAGDNNNEANPTVLGGKTFTFDQSFKDAGYSAGFPQASHLTRDGYQFSRFVLIRGQNLANNGVIQTNDLGKSIWGITGSGTSGGNIYGFYSYNMMRIRYSIAPYQAFTDSFATTSNGELEVFALWEPIVTYNANGGSGSHTDVVDCYDFADETSSGYNKNYAYGINPITGSDTWRPQNKAYNAYSGSGFTRAGYNFLGWSENPNATTATYAPGQQIFAKGYTAEPKTLYAVWQIKTYNITYNKNTTDTSVAGMPANGTLQHFAYYTIPSNIPTRTGYTFQGWTTTSGGTSAMSQYAPGSTYATYANLTLYAVWKANVYTVTLNTNGGTIGSGNVTSYTYGVGATLPTNVTKTNLYFGGWYASSDLSGSPVTAISTTDLGNKTYYAKWVSGYTITYNAAPGYFPSTGAGTAANLIVPGSSIPLPSASGGMSEIPTYVDGNGKVWGIYAWSTSTSANDIVFNYNARTGWTQRRTVTPTGPMTLYALYCGHDAWYTAFNVDHNSASCNWAASTAQGTAWDSAYCAACGKEVKRRFAFAFSSRTRPLTNKHTFMSGFVYFEPTQTSATVSATVMGFTPCELGSPSQAHFRGWTTSVDANGTMAACYAQNKEISGNTVFYASYDPGYLEYVLISQRQTLDMGLCDYVGTNYSNFNNNDYNANGSTTRINGGSSSFSQVIVKRNTDTFASTYNNNHFPSYTTWHGPDANQLRKDTYYTWRTTISGGTAFFDNRRPDKTYENEITDDSLWSAYFGYMNYFRYYAYNRFAADYFQKATFSAPNSADTNAVISPDGKYVETIMNDYDQYLFPTIERAPDGRLYGNGPQMSGSFTRTIDGNSVQFYENYSGTLPKFRTSSMLTGDNAGWRVMQVVHYNLNPSYRTVIGAYWVPGLHSMDIEPIFNRYDQSFFWTVGSEIFKDGNNYDEGNYAAYQPWDFGVKFDPGKAGTNTPKLSSNSNTNASDVYTFINITRDSKKFYLLPNDYWAYSDYYIDAWFVDINNNHILDDFEKTSYSYFPLNGSNVLTSTDDSITVFQYLFNGFESAVALGNQRGESNRILTLKENNFQMLTLTAHWEKTNVTVILEGSGFDAANSSFTYVDENNQTKTASFPTVASGEKSIRSVYAKQGTTVTFDLRSTGDTEKLAYITRNNNEDYTKELSTIPDRVIYDKPDYSFVVGSAAVFTAHYGTSGNAVLDRNNKLLTSTSSYLNNYALYSTSTNNFRTRLGLYNSGYNPRYVIYNNTKNCTLKVPSGTLVNSVSASGSGTTYTVPYDRVVTVTASSSNFKGWYANNVLVSRDRVYTFRMTGDLTLTVNTSTTMTASCKITGCGNDSARSACYAVMTWYVPEGCRVIESGFIITKDAGSGVTLNKNSIDERIPTAVGTTGQKIYPYKHYKVMSTDTNLTGSFKLMMPTSYNNRAFMGFVMYVDKNGTMQTVVSDTKIFNS